MLSKSIIQRAGLAVVALVSVFSIAASLLLISTPSTAKNVAAKTWSITASCDGQKWSAYPAGDKTCTAPIIAYTSWETCPTAGHVTNNGDENGQGCYLYIVGKNFGYWSDWGVNNHLLIGGVEVNNYRYLKPAVGPVGTVLGLKVLAVQVGALGTPTMGVALPITMTVHGQGLANAVTSGTYYNLDGKALTLTPNPGPIYFVSLTGNDANSGTFASPLRHVQTYNGSSQFAGAFYGPVSGVTTGNVVPAGTHVYVMAGEYGADTSFESRWLNLFRKTGTAPTGSAGSGDLALAPYPGAAGTNTPDVVTWTGGSSSCGGYQGADTVRSGETNVYGGTGWAQYIKVFGFKITSHALSSTDCAPINLQTNASHVQIANMELTWASSTGSPTAAGIAGEGSYTERLGNYIHDIADVSGNQQNHGIYIGNNTGATGAAQAEYHSVSAYNYIKDIPGGSGLQARGYVDVADSAPYITVHHNWIENVAKHGVNFFDQRARGLIYANVLKDIGQSPFFVNSDNVTVTGGIYFGHNTAFGWGTVAAYPAVYYNGGSNTGTVRVQSNVFMQKSGNQAPAFDVFYTTSNGLATTFSKNLWYDPNGRGSVPAGDASGLSSNPSFTSLLTPDFAPAAGSPLLDASVTPSETLPAFDFFLVARPHGSATHWTIGGVEGSN